MTVMPSSSDVADKAVSTEDASSGVEVARLEAVLAALVESKVEAMKAAATASSSSALARRSGSAPPSPRRPRLTSSSTVSSSQNHQHHHHHHHHHHHQQQQRGGPEHKRRHGHRHRRHGSAPCGDYIEDPLAHHHKQRHGRGKQKSLDSPPRECRRPRRRHSRSPQPLDPRFELLGLEAPEQELALVGFKRPAEALSDSAEYPRLHRSACYLSHSNAQLKSQFDEEDYPSFRFADAADVEEVLSDSSLGGPGRLPPLETRERFHHRPRRKRRRRRPKRRKSLVDVEGAEDELAVDPDDLPPRARWTIVATACLLLAMSLLLVGVTLRMAPIIDEMGDGRRASVCKKSHGGGNRGSHRRPSTAHRRDSIRPARSEPSSGLVTPTSAEAAPSFKLKEDPLEELRARRHRRIVCVLLATFCFILCASVLAVVVTLTHSSFHKPPVGSRELAEHRANEEVNPANTTLLRKENEELLNSLNRDSSQPVNTTSPPPA